jgi:site-specific DNA-methyltransferase (adenine-specific)
MVPYYEQDGITIYHADCRDVLPTLEAGSVDLVLTDPPFNVGFNYGTGLDDRKPPDEYGTWLRGVIDLAQDSLADGGWTFCWMAMPHCHLWHEWFPDGWRIFASLKNFVQFRPTEIQWSWDPVVFWQKGKRKSKPFAGKRDYHMGNTAAAVSRTQEAAWHPCRRPIDTARYLVELASQPDDLVLDPFMGSGTTLRAAKDLGRRAIGIEIEERYCEIAAKRLQQAVLPLVAD